MDHAEFPLVCCAEGLQYSCEVHFVIIDCGAHVFCDNQWVFPKCGATHVESHILDLIVIAGCYRNNYD